MRTCLQFPFRRSESKSKKGQKVKSDAYILWVLYAQNISTPPPPWWGSLISFTHALTRLNVCSWLPVRTSGLFPADRPPAHVHGCLHALTHCSMKGHCHVVRSSSRVIFLPLLPHPLPPLYNHPRLFLHSFVSSSCFVIHPRHHSRSFPGAHVPAYH